MVVCSVAQVDFALRFTPADELVTNCELPRRCPVKQAGQRTSATIENQILDVLTSCSAVRQIMITPQKPVKESQLFGALRRYDAERLQHTELAFDRLNKRLGHGRSRWAKSAAVIGALLSVPPADHAFLPQFHAHRATGHILEL